MTVKYYVKAPAHAQDAIITLCMKTFTDSIVGINRCVFPIDFIHCYLYVGSDLSTVELVIRSAPFEHKAKNVDCNLVIYQDIVTIPLMNRALADAQLIRLPTGV